MGGGGGQKIAGISLFITAVQGQGQIVEVLPFVPTVWGF